MSALELFRKKNKQAEDITLDKNWVESSKAELPNAPSPTSGGLDFPDHPDFSEEGKKIVLPPVEEDLPAPPAAEPMENLDAGWKEFLKQNVGTENREAQASDLPNLSGAVEEEQPQETVDSRPTIKATLTHNGPIYVEASEFSRLRGDNDMLRVKLQLMDGFFGKIEELWEKEGSELRRWHLEMDEIRKKFLLIDDVLSESGR